MVYIVLKGWLQLLRTTPCLRTLHRRPKNSSTSSVSNHSERNEVHFVVDSNLQEYGAGITFFRLGKPSADRRIPDVGFMVRSSIACKQVLRQTCHSDRIISMKLPLKSNQHLTLWQIPHTKTASIQICADICTTNLQMTRT